MLHTPDKHTNRILKLADFIEALPPEKYIQGTWTSRGGDAHCICGWAIDQANFINHTQYNDAGAAAGYLGLTAEQGVQLFCGSPFCATSNPCRQPTTAEAAKVLRHLAVSGEVNWKICEKELVDA